MGALTFGIRYADAEEWLRAGDKAVALSAALTNRGMKVEAIASTVDYEA